MRRYALLGGRVEGSLSPAIHEQIWQQLGAEATYELWSVRVDAFEAALERARHELAGFNLTAPFKVQVLTHLDDSTALAQQLSSVNTVRVEQGALIGHNTDLDGVAMTLDRLPCAAGAAMILGAGGVVPSVVHELVRRDFGPLWVACRNAAAARRRLAPWGDHLEVIPYAHAAEYLEGCQLVINATPLGAGASDALPIASEQVDGLVHWDLVYRREATTPWVAHALQRGQFAVDGRLMLARQAVEAQRFWGYPVEDAAAVYRRWCGE